MRSIRLSKRFTRAPAVAAVVAVGLSLPLGVWVAADESSESPTSAMVINLASHHAPATSDGAALSPSPMAALPPDLALRAAAHASRDDAVAIVASAARAGGERLLALRALARSDEPRAIVEAEAIVLRAGASREERALATNALGVLARAANGRPALERCAELAGSDDLRRSARVLLVRTGR